MGEEPLSLQSNKSSQTVNGHGASALGTGTGTGSASSSAGWDASSLAAELCRARGGLQTEPRGGRRGALQTEAQTKRSTLGESRMKTQGSMMELTEMKRRAIRSRPWDSPSHRLLM